MLPNGHPCTSPAQCVLAFAALDGICGNILSQNRRHDPDRGGKNGTPHSSEPAMLYDRRNKLPKLISRTLSLEIHLSSFGLQLNRSMQHH